jgi:hypothetical protein
MTGSIANHQFRHANNTDSGKQRAHVTSEWQNPMTASQHAPRGCIMAKPHAVPINLLRL